MRRLSSGRICFSTPALNQALNHIRSCTRLLICIVETYVVAVSASNMPLVRCVQSRGRDRVVVVVAEEVPHHRDLLVGSRRDASSVVSEAICQGTVLGIEEVAEAVTAAEGGLFHLLLF